MSASEVIIVGAGPVGLVTAYGLARAGIPVTVLEAERQVIDSPRAMVYHWALHQDLDRLELLHDIEERGFRKDDYGYRVHATGEMVTYDMDGLARETPYPYNIHLGQDALCELVLTRLKAFPHASVRWGARVTGLSQDRHTVQLDVTGDDGAGAAERFSGAWVIGCDGARSTVRRLLGMGFEGMTWDTRFVATNVYFDFRAHGLAHRLRLRPGGGAADVRGPAADDRRPGGVPGATDVPGQAGRHRPRGPPRLTLAVRVTARVTRISAGRPGDGRCDAVQCWQAGHQYVVRPPTTPRSSAWPSRGQLPSRPRARMNVPV